MDILLSTDNNYVMPTGVLMTSVSMNNKDVHYHVLVNETFELGNRKMLENTAKKYGNSIRFYSISDSMVSMCPIGEKGQTEYITVSSYYRLFVAQILPPDIHRILYLDGDMIVRRPLTSLWDTNLSDFALGVVHDMDETMEIQRMPYPCEDGYFNAGMLLINLDYWRDNKCQERCLDFILSKTMVLNCHDQDVLNCVLHNEKKWIPITYNFQHGFIYDLKSEQRYHPCLEDEIRQTEKNPAIIHYCAPLKPWHYSCLHPQRFVWNYYKRKSLWKKYRPDSKH